jgi:hypothetical protein
MKTSPTLQLRSHRLKSHQSKNRRQRVVKAVSLYNNVWVCVDQPRNRELEKDLINSARATVSSVCRNKTFDLDPRPGLVRRKEITGAMVVDATLNEIVTEQVLSLPYKASG